jgi:hypothetical protein
VRSAYYIKTMADFTLDRFKEDNEFENQTELTDDSVDGPS